MPWADDLMSRLKATGLGPRELERATGVSNAVISRILTGARSAETLSLATAEKLATYVGLELRPKRKGK